MRGLFFLLILIPYLAYSCPELNFSCPDGGTYPLHLSFDDGPHDYNTGRILDILKSEKVPASFYLQILKLTDRQGEVINYSGRRADLEKKGIPNYYYFLLDRMRQEGHSIGSHAYEHWHHVDSYQAGENWRQNLRLGYPEVLREYFEASGVSLMRLPHGQGWFEQNNSNPDKRRIAEEIMDELEKMGMLHVGWNIDSLDWRYDSEKLSYKNIDDEIEYFSSEVDMNKHYQQGIVNQLCQQRGGIILMHDAKEISWKNLRCVIQGLKRGGHQFVLPQDLIGFERPWGAPLIGRKSMDQKICCGFFDSTTSPLKADQGELLDALIQYVIKKNADYDPNL